MPRWMTMDSSRLDVWDSTRVRRPATSEVQIVLGLLSVWKIVALSKGTARYSREPQ